MTSSHYNNVIQWTLCNMGTIFQDDSVFAARTVFKNCGVAFPEGNCTDVLSTLMSNDYVGWRMCTIEEAQMCANEGKAALGISEEQVVIVKPEEEKVLVKSTFVNPKARSGFAGTIDVMKNKRESEMQFFAYSVQGQQPIHPYMQLFVDRKSVV